MDLPQISIDDINTGLSLMQHVTSVIGGIQKLLPKSKDQEELRRIINELLALQQVALAANADREKACRIAGELRAQIEAYEKWDEEASRYELKEVATGLTVYTLRPDHAPMEAPHWLCTGCYTKRQKGIFTLISKAGMIDKEFSCPLCKFTIKTTKAPGR